MLEPVVEGAAFMALPGGDSGGSPPVDDTALFDLRQGRYALPMTQLALDLGVFERLGPDPRATAAVGDAIGLSARGADAMFCVLAALGWIDLRPAGGAALTPVAMTYLRRDSPFFRGRLLEATDPTLRALAVACQRETGPASPLAGALRDLSAGEVADFIGRMDALGRPAAPSLASQPPFCNARRVLDVG
ncbi:MAG TPA: hypothetical protein VFH51_18890, partial [Myxococcota bacterium]|nr:hypothetical protein [Myxococcota bacterium]